MAAWEHGGTKRPSSHSRPGDRLWMKSLTKEIVLSSPSVDVLHYWGKMAKSLVPDSVPRPGSCLPTAPLEGPFPTWRTRREARNPLAQFSQRA